MALCSKTGNLKVEPGVVRYSDISNAILWVVNILACESSSTKRRLERVVGSIDDDDMLGDPGGPEMKLENIFDVIFVFAEV
jgi:hypothetical protein